MRLAWAALLIAASLLVGLRVGRPLYYTDGTTQVDGRTLAGAGMLRWRSPEALAEVPGPIAGRVTMLPDGRLLYGRLQENGAADLVLWDPARAAVPPEPLFGLATEHNELAPTLAADGSLWFASDRPGGAGGYDLYRAPSLQAMAAQLVPLAACNTALDETDPTVHGNGVDLVFVRSDRRIDGGNDGVLWRMHLGDELDPVPVWAAARPGHRPLDRDPYFAADGASLWFVRKLPGQPLTLQRASWLAGAFDHPCTTGEEWRSGELRSPMPSADGRRLALLQARQEGAAALLYQSVAYEVLPWWPGQRWLEWLLLGVVITSLVLLLLLHLGRRWSTLDLVAQCLLLSLLLHLLLFLWLMGVEIAGALQPGEDSSSGFEVNVLTATAASGGAASSVEAETAFTPTERALAAAAPTTSPARDTASERLDGPQGELPSEPAAQAVTAAAELADAATPLVTKQGQDAAVEVAAAELPTIDRRAAEQAAAASSARASASSEQVTVQTPGSGLPRVTDAVALAAPAALHERPSEPAAAMAAPTSPALADAPDAAVAPAASSRSDAAVATPVPAASGGVAAPQPSSATAAVRGATTASPLAADARPAPAAAMVRASRAVLAVPQAERRAESLPSGRAMPLADSSLRDAAAALQPVAAAPSPAKAPAAAAPRPSDVPLEKPTQQAGVAVARTAAAGQPQPAAATPLPAASLVRNRPSALASSGVAATELPMALRATAPARTPTLRDASAATGNPAAPARTGAIANKLHLSPVAVELSRPHAGNLDRPTRARDVGAFAVQEQPPTPPRSALVRATAAPAALPAFAQLAKANAYSNRFGPAKAQAIERFGGNDATERAVMNGLRYLARIQHDNGAWGNREDYDGKYGFVHVGKTALCLLAFLGAGHTPASRTEHSATTSKALAYLLSVQEADTGAFGPSSCYGHGIATYAVAECYGITKQTELLQPLERALTWIIDHQGPRRDRRNRGGWGYFSPGLQAEDDYARVSVTAWMVMALESARLSGVELPETVLPRAREYLELSYDQPNGWFRYNHKPSRVNSSWPTLPASTPAAAFCLQLLGCKPDDERIAAAVTFTTQRRPERYRRYGDDDFVLRGQGNVYFWYYGTLCCFLAGGDAWTQWNERLRTVLPKAQNRDGSFTPIDVYAEEAGDSAEDRSYTTAMCVLCLEVYYRYFTPLLLGR